MSIAKSVLSGSAILTASRLFSKSILIFSSPILTALLGPDAYGVAAVATTLISLAAVLSLTGIDMAYARFYFIRESRQVRNDVEIFCWRYVCLATVLSVLWVLWAISSFKTFETIAAELYWIIVLTVILTPVSTMAIARRRLLGQYYLIASSIALSGVITVVTSIAIAKFWRSDAVSLLLGGLSGYLTTIVMLRIVSPIKILKGGSSAFSQRMDIVKMGFAGAVTAPMYWMISSSDRWFVGYFRGSEDVGVYSFAFSVGSIGLMLNYAITQTWFPEASRAYRDNPESCLNTLGRLWERMVVGLLLSWLCIVSSGGEALQLLSAEPFHSGVKYVPFFATGVFFYGVSSLANTGLLLSNNMRWSAFAWILSAVLVLSINYVFVPHFGAIVAAISQSIGFFVVACLSMVMSQRYIRLTISWDRLLVVCISTFLVGLIMMRDWGGTPVTSLLLKFPVGCVYAILVVRFTMPDWLKKIVVWLSNRPIRFRV